MESQEKGFQAKLFYHQVSLEQKVPKNHLLRKIREQIDFDFVYREVRDSYGDNGNVSVPPHKPRTGFGESTIPIANAEC